MTKRLLPDPDLEALIRRLNSSAETAQTEGLSEVPDAAGEPAAPTTDARFPRWSLPKPTDEGRERLWRLLVVARDAQASDLMLVAGRPPVVRVDGQLTAVGEEPLDPGGTGLLCGALVPDTRRDAIEASGAVDFAFTSSGVGRFRCNVHREQNRWSAAIRLLPEKAPNLGELHLPGALARFAELEYGLVLVTGPTGSGKSTTLAALMKCILARRRVHVITVEDPVEYSHPHGESVVEHIEIGRDAASFADALRAALRQDPDVLLVGEMRDSESISTAITAAETGHLVLSTLHTGDGPQTVHRILDSYPAVQMETVRVQLSVSLAGVISQQLLPRTDGRGRVPAVEVMMATHAVRNLIRRGKIAHLRSQIMLEKSAGMLDLDQNLAELVREGLVSREVARPRARVPEEFDRLLAGKRQG